MSLKSYFEFLLEQEVFPNGKLNYLEIKNISRGNRLIDHVVTTNESAYAEFNLLTEKEKYDVDNLVWAGIFEYATHEDPDRLDEGFWGDLISGIRDMGQKALNFTLGVLKNISGFFGNLMKFIREFFATVAKKAGELGEGLWSKIKGKAEEKAKEKVSKIDPEEAKKDLGNLKDTVSWIGGKAVNTLLEDGEKEGAAALKQAATEDKESAEKIAANVKKELQAESLLFNTSLANTINEIRSNPDFDMSEFVNEINKLGEAMNESDDPKQEIEVKKKTLWQKIKKGGYITTVISLICSGVVVFFEKVVAFLTSGSLHSCSKIVNAFGGPGVFKFVAIGTIVGTITGLAVEIASEFIHGHDIVGKIAHAMHASNPMHYLREAAAEMAIPGAKTVVTCITYSIIIYIGTTHIVHAIKGDKH